MVPPDTVISVASKLVDDADRLKLSATLELFDTSPLATSEEEIVTVGTVVLYVQLNCEEALLLLLVLSVKAPLRTSIVVAPAEAGVNVAV